MALLINLINALRDLLYAMAQSNPLPLIALLLCITVLLQVVKK